MIEKLNNDKDFKSTYEADFLYKINEIVDVVNDLVEQLHRLVDTQIVDGGRLQAIKDMVNVHEREIDQLQMSICPEKCNYDDERKWIGKLCKFRDGEDFSWQYGILTDIVVGNDYPYWMGSVEFAECQPVLEEEFKDVIYKKGQK